MEDTEKTSDTKKWEEEEKKRKEAEKTFESKFHLTTLKYNTVIQYINEKGL
jgi:hypothetical protein